MTGLELDFVCSKRKEEKMRGVVRNLQEINHQTNNKINPFSSQDYHEIAR